ncbi:MAG: AAA family ATPase [Candidatus Moranbacteria bacterium]|nr:AAA family ATPase [Candidatus Moranbacteria bacterium]
MQIIGHHKEREVLRQSREHQDIAQAYLFIGPRSIGKSLCALELAASLAQEPLFEPSEEKPHPYDVMILQPLEETKRGVTKTKNISAESVREALTFLASYPASGSFRVLIIEDAHRLSETAQNVLLKTLEEPQSSAVIILVTHEIGAILPTVLSRVKRVRFDFVPEAVIRDDLARLYSGDKLGAVAPFFYALGRPGMIRLALDHPENFVVERELLGSLFRLSTLSSAERLALAEKLGGNTEQTIRLLEWWLPGLYHQAIKLGETKTTKRFYELLDEVEKTMRLLKTTQSNARLLLEKLFLSV